MISGDLADTPVAEEYEHLKRLLAPLEIGFAAVPGNHDSRELMRTALSKSPKGGYAQPGDALNSLHAVGSLDLILLDSSCRANRMASSTGQHSPGSMRRSLHRQRGRR